MNGGDAGYKNAIEKSGGRVIGNLLGIAAALAIISIAVGIALYAFGTRRSVEEGKEKIMNGALALVLVGVFFTIVGIILAAIE